MKLKQALVIASLGLALSSGIAQAGILVQSSGSDICEKVVGDWEGTGHISAYLVINCDYTGTGKITKMGNNGAYNVHMDLKAARSSSFLCTSFSQDLAATCHNGNVAIQTNKVHMNGTTDGNVANFQNGTVKVGIVSANIDYIRLKRK